MISTNDLKKARKVRERAEKSRKKHAEKLRADWNQQKQVQDQQRVDRWFDGAMDNLLRLCDSQNRTEIRLDAFRVWYMATGWYGFQEMYGEESPLDFEPKPDYPPAQAVVKMLQSVGFDAKIETVMRQKTEAFVTADGYDFRYLPGNEPIHYIRIKW